MNGPHPDSAFPRRDVQFEIHAITVAEFGRPLDQRAVDCPAQQCGNSQWRVGATVTGKVNVSETMRFWRVLLASCYWRHSGRHMHRCLTRATLGPGPRPSESYSYR